MMRTIASTGPAVHPHLPHPLSAYPRRSFAQKKKARRPKPKASGNPSPSSASSSRRFLHDTHTPGVSFAIVRRRDGPRVG